MDKKLIKIKNFIIYQTLTSKINIEVYFQNDTLWLSQKVMAKLFNIDRSVISKHLKNIFDTEGLLENSVCADFTHTAEDGKNYKTKFYNLRTIIAVGYGVNSKEATEFRKWAIETLHQYIVKGFILDDERLKQGRHFGQDYFDELLEKIREIRLSERRFYQKITDIYALSADYTKDSQLTKDFFATTQNKLHWAIAGKTAAEIIYSEADAKKIFMGLKNWKNAPKGKILKSDVVIAKNYLNEDHLKQLQRLVTAYLDLAENRAERNIIMNMEDWIKFLNRFLELSDYPVLKDKGKVSMLQAQLKVEKEYSIFRIKQDKEYISDFDKETKKYLAKEDDKK